MRLHHVGPRRAGRREHLAQIGEHARRLLDDATLHDLAGGRIERDLPRGEEKAARDDRLRIRSDRRGGGLGLDTLLRHTSPCQK